jgi:hypothetical protein
MEQIIDELYKNILLVVDERKIIMNIYNISLFVTELMVLANIYKIRGLEKKQLVLSVLELIIQRSNLTTIKKAKLLEYKRDIAPCIIDIIIAVNNKKINISNKHKLFCF